jgi:tRNA U34 5-carboxymethylaminomethyl modifying GTPase MnmE/TrmE
MELDEMLEHEVHERTSFYSQNKSSTNGNRKSLYSMRSMQIKNNNIFSGNPTPTKIHLVDRNDTSSSAHKAEKSWKDNDYSHRESLDVSKDLDDLHIQIGKLFSKNTTSRGSLHMGKVKSHSITKLARTNTNNFLSLHHSKTATPMDLTCKSFVSP